MAEDKEKDTENLILDAAMKVFTRHGFAGARTEDIAREAGINRALLHYYFRDKKTMFDIIFETRFKEFFSSLIGIIASEQPLLDKIKSMVAHEIDTLIRHPDMPRFVISEIASQPERLFELGQKMGINPRQFVTRFEEQVAEAVAAGQIRPISGKQLLMNIMSLCLYPFIAKPVVKAMLQLDERAFTESMEQRKTEVSQFIINALKP